MTVTPNNMNWQILITCNDKQVGKSIRCSRWDVLGKLAAVRHAIPLHWRAEAYPIIHIPSKKCDSCSVDSADVAA